jgi:ribosomal protein L11 methyltransferase
MCLEAMERVSPTRPWTLLDVGTGSGILAIYGITLGAERVMAIDTDPEAIRWAEENIRLNKVAEAVRLSQEPAEQMRETFSLVCANLILGEILRLMPSLSHLTKREGSLILSGILENQVPEVAASCSKNNLEIRDTLYQGEWACVIAAKRP